MFSFVFSLLLWFLQAVVFTRLVVTIDGAPGCSGQPGLLFLTHQCPLLLSTLLPPRFRMRFPSSRPSTHSCRKCTTHSLCR